VLLVINKNNNSYEVEIPLFSAIFINPLSVLFHLKNVHLYA